MFFKKILEVLDFIIKKKNEEKHWLIVFLKYHVGTKTED